MVNTGDPDIVCWSEDGETFVVKDPQKFQEVCIPAYFKHAKFSSFVRQLNFYAFRKIKYSDNVRLDPKLEAETANFWRFRHENFRRGHPELLIEIKRVNSQKNSNTKPAPTDDKGTKTEVQSLKKRIEEMSKNIDELTAMVQKVSLKQDEQESRPLLLQDTEVGAKRKKLDPTEVPGHQSVRPDDMLSSMDLDIPEIPAPMPLSARENSDDTPEISDIEFVDDLLSTFNDGGESGLLGWDMADPVIQQSREVANRPDPELMERLGEALALLPKDIQVLIVDRLIVAITSTDFQSSLLVAEAEPKKEATKSSEVPATPSEGEKEASLPLAAATLAALLHHYGSQVKGKSPKSVQQKTIPVIPVHA